MKQQKIEQLERLVADGYNQIAAEFDITRKKLFDQTITASVKSGESVIDVGCGSGRLLDILPQGINYLGIDSSEKLLELAKSNYPNHQFQLGKLPELKITEQFDQVFCKAVLHHIPSREQRILALKQLWKIKKAAGSVNISVWYFYRDWKYLKLIIKSFSSDIIFPWNHTVSRYYHAYTKRELARDAKLAGFKNYTVKRKGSNLWLQA
jgi:2-polyprenyl-3-methyl-5-hydroxy-6-metoxy-1,4-benzoquinol methylase